MASSKRIINVGASARASDVQKVSDVAAAADDRALEILCTPGSTLKTVTPLSEETASLNPRLLVAGKDTDATLANGKVRVRPAWFRAGSDAYTVALSAKLAANSDSPTIGNNSSGATRTDLLYATISYGTTTTETVRQKPTSGSTPVSVSLTTQKDMKVTVSVVAGVASGNPTASLPADDTVNGVYNFALAALSIADGYAGGAINQSSITPLWSGGTVSRSIISGMSAMSIFSSAVSEKPTNIVSSRLSNGNRFFAYFKLLSTTPTSAGGGVIIDNSIDWRRRLVSGVCSYLGSASQLPLESQNSGLGGTAVSSAFGGFLGNITGGGATFLGQFNALTYNSGSTSIGLTLDGNGSLCITRTGSPVDGVNGDLIFIDISVTDRLLSSV